MAKESLIFLACKFTVFWLNIAFIAVHSGECCGPWASGCNKGKHVHALSIGVLWPYLGASKCWGHSVLQTPTLVMLYHCHISAWPEQVGQDQIRAKYQFVSKVDVPHLWNRSIMICFYSLLIDYLLSYPINISLLEMQKIFPTIVTAENWIIINTSSLPFGVMVVIYGYGSSRASS